MSKPDKPQKQKKTERDLRLDDLETERPEDVKGGSTGTYCDDDKDDGDVKEWDGSGSG